MNLAYENIQIFKIVFNCLIRKISVGHGVGFYSFQDGVHIQ